MYFAHFPISFFDRKNTFSGSFRIFQNRPLTSLDGGCWSAVRSGVVGVAFVWMGDVGFDWVGVCVGVGDGVTPSP